MTDKEQQMFARLHDVPGFRQWLLDEYSKTCDTMALMLDETQLRLAQGQAQRLKKMLASIEASGRKPR